MDLKDKERRGKVRLGQVKDGGQTMSRRTPLDERARWREAEKERDDAGWKERV